MLTVPCLKNGKIHILDVFVEMHMFFFTQKHLGSIAEHVILHHRNNREQNNRKEIGNFFCFIGTDNERYLSFLCFLMCIFYWPPRPGKTKVHSSPTGGEYFFSISYVEGGHGTPRADFTDSTDLIKIFLLSGKKRKYFYYDFYA